MTIAVVTNIIVRYNKHCGFLPHAGHMVAQAVSHSLSWRRLRFVPVAVHMKFMVNKVALGQVFMQILKFFPILSFHQCSILLMLHSSTIYAI
jgi:hypothetical protein